MKKATVFLFLLVLCLCSCSNKGSFVGLKNSEYRSEFECYDTNVQVMMEVMQLDAQQADSAFGLLIKAGIHEEISNIIQMYDGHGNEYYRVWWGKDYSTSAEIYVEDGEVTKISSGENILYDAHVTDTVGETSVGGDTQQVNGDTEESMRETGSEAYDSSLQSSDSTENGAIELQSLTTPIKRGSTAYMEIKGIPGQEYSITVYYASSTSKAADLIPKIADENGTVTWKWKVGVRTAAGTYKITVSGGGDTLETVFVVTE